MDTRTTLHDNGPSGPVAFVVVATFASGLVWLIALLSQFAAR